MVADPGDVFAKLIGPHICFLESILEDAAYVEQALEHPILDDGQMSNTPFRHLSKHVLVTVLDPAECEVCRHDCLDRHAGRRPTRKAMNGSFI